MEIINETLHTIGGDINGWAIFRFIFCILCISLWIWCIIASIHEHSWLLTIIGCGLIVLYIFCSITAFNDITNKVEYREYDVIFTEPVDINELNEKYEIKGNDGRIWHLEDKH